MASTLDPGGRLVELTEERWRQIADGHPEFAPDLAALIEAVRSPSRRMHGPRSGEKWCYLEDAGPSRWLKVVVHYEGGRGRIVTAFAHRSMP